MAANEVLARVADVASCELLDFIEAMSFTGRMGTTLGDQWVPPERLRRGLFDHSRDQASSPAGLATTS